MKSVHSYEIKGVQEIGEKKLVGFRVVCDDMTGYGQEIPKASMLLNRRKGEIKHLLDPVKLIGAFKAKETTEDDGYWVCYEVNEIEEVPKDMVSLVVPSQSYAVLSYKGHASEIYHVYSHLHNWVNESEFKRNRNQWTLEIYSKWTEKEDEVELCDPVTY